MIQIPKDKVSFSEPQCCNGRLAGRVGVTSLNSRAWAQEAKPQATGWMGGLQPGAADRKYSLTPDWCCPILPFLSTFMLFYSSLLKHRNLKSAHTPSRMLILCISESHSPHLPKLLCSTNLPLSLTDLNLNQTKRSFSWETKSSRMYSIMLGKHLVIFSWCLAGHILSVNVSSVLKLGDKFPGLPHFLFPGAC